MLRFFMDEGQAQERRQEQTAEPLKPFFKRVPVIVAGAIIVGLALFFGIDYLVESFTHESTNDAFLDADYVSLAPRVAAPVAKVYVRSNQKVKAGDILLELDPRDFQVALDQKRAALKAAQANVDLIKASVELFRTQIASAEATAKQTAAEAAASKATAQRAAADFKRAEELIKNHTISQQEFDAGRAATDAAEASFRAAQEKAVSDQAKVGQSLAQFEAGKRGYERAQEQSRQAEWDVKAAELTLSYARITAPVNGYVTKKAVQEGDYVQVGQKLMALVPETLYVTANFKETQLRNIRTNQPVRVSIDSIRGGPYAGHVQSIMAGSGSRFSLLPPENAVGNYIKVVQRVPVKIVFDAPVETGHVLGPGMSAVPLVRISAFELGEKWVAAIAILGAFVVGVIWWLLARPAAVEEH